MRVFLDTNILLEYLCERPKASVVNDLLDLLEEKNSSLFISSSSFCTIAYYVEMMLKGMGFHKPEKTLKTRQILNVVLEIVKVVETNHVRTILATNDLAFSDFEDSMQYQCALNNNCDAIVTFNQSDYKYADQTLIKVFSPDEFLKTAL